MSKYERAAQIWPLLAWAAKNRQILTYEIVGSLIGVPHFGLSSNLDPIQSLCLRRNIPALTVLVVKNDGRPGGGFTAAEDVLAEQQRVFRHDWLQEPSPSPDDFASAQEKGPTAEPR
jgi:hypothetical protein